MIIMICSNNNNNNNNNNNMNTGRRLDAHHLNQIDFTQDNLDIGADVFSENGKSSRCIKDRTENKWIFYTKHILHQLKILMSITAKVYPNCEKKFHCYLKS